MYMKLVQLILIQISHNSAWAKNATRFKNFLTKNLPPIMVTHIFPEGSKLMMHKQLHNKYFLDITRVYKDSHKT